MEREQTIEALKICDSNYDGVVCKKCPIKDEDYNGSWCDEDGDCYQHLMREAAELLSEQPTIQPEQQWIPVSERMPEESGWYICTCRDGVSERVTFLKWQKRLKQWEKTGTRSYWKVIAWLPLPEPYQKGEHHE